MTELKTKRTDQNVEDFLRNIPDEQKRQDCFTLLEIMKQVTHTEPQMWGDSIVGFGHYHYQYASGREGDWFLTGFSPRKQNLTLYLMAGFEPYAELLKNLGKHKIGKSCLYLKQLEDIDLPILTELIRQSVKHMAQTNG